MLPGLAETRRAVLGAWRLVCGKADGLAFMDLSIDGFWRSFGVFAYLVPLIVLGTLMQESIRDARPDLDPTGPTGLVRHVLEIAVTLFAWLVVPAVLALLARPLGIERRFVPFIAARNWSAIVESIPFTLIAVLYLLGLLDVETVQALHLVALGFSIFVTVQVTRLTLGAPASIVTAVVVLNFLLSFVIVLGALRLAGSV